MTYQSEYREPAFNHMPVFNVIVTRKPNGILPAIAPFRVESNNYEDAILVV